MSQIRVTVSKSYIEHMRQHWARERAKLGPGPVEAICDGQQRLSVLKDYLKQLNGDHSESSSTHARLPKTIFILCHNLTLISLDAFSKKMMDVRAPFEMKGALCDPRPRHHDACTLIVSARA